MNAVSIDLEQFVQISHSEPVTTSEFVAKAFGKKHCNVLAKIEEIFTQVPDSFIKLNFKFNEKIVKVGFGERHDKVYELTKDGFILLVMGFTGKNAMSIKIAYINAFNAMAEKLRQIQAQQHVAISHLISKEQADTIQRAVEERGNRTGEPYQKIYAGLHAYLGIDSYKTMPVEHFTAAIKYLSSIENAPELIKQSDEVLVHLGNLKALIYHMDWCFCWFQFVYKSLRHLNNDLVVPMIDKFGDGHLAAGLLAYPLGIKMLPLQEMYYFPWEKDAKTQDSYWENYVKRNMICRPYFSMK